jgi:hypothetical protein
MYCTVAVNLRFEFLYKEINPKDTLRLTRRFADFGLLLLKIVDQGFFVVKKGMLMKTTVCVVLLLSIISCIVFSAEPSKTSLQAPVQQDRKLVIVTIDGLRWQEVFKGADPKLVKNESFVQNIEYTKARFWDESSEIRRLKLMPFLTKVINIKGTIIGDRSAGSFMSATNQQYFSYPGYNEIFTGRTDPELTSNAKIPNPNITFLEWLNNKPRYKNKIGIFSGWDVFPLIYNRQRSGLFINAGFEPFTLPNQAALEQQELKQISVMNSLQAEIPSPWQNVRHDAFTFGFAKFYLQHQKPTILVVNFGETDDFAHNGKYDAYLDSAHQTDAYLEDMWLTLQGMPDYKDNTNLLIITDHGRGSNENDWQHHASAQAVRNYMQNLDTFKDGIVGSKHIWFAAMGPDIKAQGLLVSEHEKSQSQFAATALALLGRKIADFSDKSSPILKDVIHE